MSMEPPPSPAQPAPRREVEESHRLLALGESIANMGTWHYDTGSGVLDCSDGIHRIFGIPADTRRVDLAAGIRIWHPDDRKAHRRCFEQALATGTGFAFDGRLLLASGEIREVSEVAQCQTDAKGKVLCVYGVVRDVTAGREAERRLAEVNDRLTVATEAGRVGIWELSCISGRFVTDEICRTLSQAPDPRVEPEPQFWWDIVHPDDRHIIDDEMTRCLAGGSFDIQYRLQRNDGSIRYVQSRARLIHGDSGEPLKILGTTWDITEIRLLNELLVEEKQRAEQASQTKSNFLAMMSHEIRTPMNGVMGMNEMLLESGLNPRQRLYAETIRDSSVSLLKIIDSILDHSKLEAGKVGVTNAAFDPRQLVEQAVTAFTPAAQHKALALRADFTACGTRPLLGDAALIRQILLNLLSNAIKFTEQGAVTIIVSTTPFPLGEHLRISVRDTGIGIPAAVRPKLFAPFEQADNTITRRFGGTGLGLSICRRLATLMQGSIAMTENPGGGSIFRLDLDLAAAPGLEDATPAGDPPAPPIVPAAEPAPIAAMPARGGHLLVVEDNNINARVIGAFLTAGGYTFDIASDGVEALEALDRRPYDLVLMDVQMPRLDGLSATREIRRRAAPGSHLPIVAMTANAMKEDEMRCREAGMDDYMAKPLNSGTVFATVARWIAPSA